ncbi:carbohydrate binding family 9 domain-containing protein [Candidatus Poribacteria bacterium]|nr:carbohydrate binding family 9 domain-containing protein [Candidatus Poribacteria bacterium]
MRQEKFRSDYSLPLIFVNPWSANPRIDVLTHPLTHSPTHLSLCRFVCSVMILCLFSLSGRLWAEEAAKLVRPQKRHTAVRAEEALRIDGILDDDVWKTAPIAEGFTKRTPEGHEGEPASCRTTVQVAYDDEAVYVGAFCYQDPETIVRRLYRRDQARDTDAIGVSFDAFHDRRMAWFFAVTPAGTLEDGVQFNDTDYDTTWNGVWEVKTSVNDEGWCAEFRIPYHNLRFSKKEEHVWGFNVHRRIQSKKEWTFWSLIIPGDSGWVSKFGEIDGIRDIHPPRHMELIPYTRARSIFSPKTDVNTDGRDLSAALGGDVRYGITPNISLNATINPDFGQVEADPSVLNLTVFETFFDERRPFFVEGGTLFATQGADIVGIGSPYQLFYSRRIGRNPGFFPTPEGSREIERPDATTILGAAKVTGKTSGKTSFALIEAVTQEEFAKIDMPTTNPATGLEEFKRRDFRIEPAANFLIGKVQQDFRNHSNVSATFTSVNRVGAPPAVAGGLDGNLKWKNNAYNLFLRAAGSQTGALDGRKGGYAAQAYFYKFSGWFGGQLFSDFHSKDFNVNDLGFMERTGILRVGAHAYAQRQKPWLLARRSGYNINVWARWNEDGINLTKGLNLNNWNQLKFYGFAGWGLSHEWEGKDDLATRGGPVMVDPAAWWGWFNLGSDESKALSASFNMRWRQAERDRGHGRNYGLNIGFRPSPNVELSVRPGIGRDKNGAQWVTNVDEDGDGTNDRFLFGELVSRTLDLTMRAHIGFTPTFTLQAYLQPFIAVGDYGKIKALARPDSYEFVPYDKPLGFNPDFHQRSLRGNVVLRWEYQPGSVLFVVWSQNRSASPEVNNPTLDAFDNLKSSFTDDGQNVFLVKMDYWFGM